MDTPHSENGGQNPPSAPLTHHAVDGLQHEPGQTPLVYAKSVKERDGTPPALEWQARHVPQEVGMRGSKT
jgi:hypothetical protein